jgi:hypothetical protein
MQCQARILEEETVYTIGETDFVATRQCSVATTKSLLCEGARFGICEACTQKRKKGQGQGQEHEWNGWFDDTMPSDAIWVHSRRFYEALLEAYKNEEGGQNGKTSPGTLFKWFQKNLAEGEREELEEELGGIRKELGEGNKPEDMPFTAFLGLVKRRMAIEKRLHSLTS